MFLPSLSGVRRCLLALVAATVLAVPVLAADDEEGSSGPFREPGIDYREADNVKPYIDWLFGALLIAGSAFMLFKNPHRSHLD